VKLKSTELIVGLLIGLLMGTALGFFLAPRGVIPTVRIISAGSTTIYPLSAKWAGEYQAVFPSVQVQVSAGGSGLGQTNVAEGIVDIGASSSYPSSSYRSANPTVKIIPVAADALAVIGHSTVNGTAGLKLTRNQVISIFNGSITTWEAFEATWGVSIAATGTINVYVRSDASGATATFTKWLQGGVGWSLGSSESISWPALPSFHAVDGNPGVKSSVQAQVGSVGYAGLAFTAGVTAVVLYNQGNGEWVTPSPDAAKIAIPSNVTDPGASLMDSSTPGAYPVVRLLFYLVNTLYLRQSAHDFVRWCVTTGQNTGWIRTDVGYLEIAGTGAQTLALSILDSFTPLPSAVLVASIPCVLPENRRQDCRD
jgi:ABC-type phosphate transport system substrate-binding protein